MPTALTLAELSCRDCPDIDFGNKVEELASIEMAVHLARQIADDTAGSDSLEKLMNEAGVCSPRSISLSDIEAMSNRTRGYAIRNIGIARDEINSKLGGIFSLDNAAEDGEDGRPRMMLHEWLEEGRYVPLVLNCLAAVINICYYATITSYHLNASHLFASLRSYLYLSSLADVFRKARE